MKKTMSIPVGRLRHIGNFGLVALLAALLAACAARQPAPVSESRPSPSAPVRTSVPADTQGKPAVTPADKPADAERTYVIQKGDTLIGIALQNGLDYRELAAWNNIENPNVIKLGETLRLTAPGTPLTPGATIVAVAPGAQPKPGEPVTSPLIITPVPSAGTSPGNTEKLKTEPRAGKIPYSDAAYAKLSAEAAAGTTPALTATPVVVAPPVATAPAVTPTATAVSATGDVDWAWPIQPPPKTRIIGTFTEASKGIDISGAKNSPVLASAPGKIVYSGAGLRGYGRLVIIKHNEMWLSAYAHNEKILVMEGQDVKKGQPIAEMGSSDTDQVKLHFEIRRQGKPVDPMKFLPN